MSLNVSVGSKRRASASSGTGIMKRFKASERSKRKIVQRLALPIETKYYETLLNNGSLTATPGITCLNTIDAGDNFNQRNGRQILNKYVQYNFQMLAAAALTAPVRYDLWIVLDRQPNSVTATAAEIFDVSTISSPLWMKNIKTNQERFKILKHHYGLVGTGAAINNVVSDFIDLSKLPERDRIVRYLTDTGAPVPSTNSILCVFASSTGTSNVVGFLGGFRYAFVE